jgi:hypothetical protein
LQNKTTDTLQNFGLTNLIRGGSNKTAAVSKISCPVIDMTQYVFEDRLDGKQRKIKNIGIRYNYTGPKKNKGKNNNPNKITKFYSCGMIQERRNGPWKPDQQKRGTGMEKTNEEEVKQKKGRGGGKVDKKKNAAIIRYGGTLHVIFQRARNHSFVFGTKLHRCMVGQGGSGEPDNQIPMAVIQPNVNWGVQKEKLMEVKEELVKLETTQWHNLNKCGSERQYLPGLCTNTKMSQLKTKMEELIGIFVKNYIMKYYPIVDKFRVGAIRSTGGRSQYELTGVYHRNYLQDVVDKRIQDEQPFSIILALYEFQFQYKNAIMDEEVELVCVPIGLAALFSNALSHCRGENGTEDHVYCLFAYVVSDEADYPQGVIERDVKDDIVVQE